MRAPTEAEASVATREIAAGVAFAGTDQLNVEARKLLEPATVTTTIIGGDRGAAKALAKLDSFRGQQPVKKRRGKVQKLAGVPLSDEGTEGTLVPENVWMVEDLVSPPYDARMLCQLHEHSNSLRQNVDAYAVNIDGFGHSFEPAIKLDSDDTRVKVREAMYLDRLLAENGGAIGPTLQEPTDAEVDAKIAELKRVMLIEKARVESFFKFCCPDMPFTTLRRRTRTGMEITGNGFWEVIRNRARMPQQFVLMPSHSVRLVRKDDERVPVTQTVQHGPITFEEVTVVRTFRRYVQAVGAEKPVWFKEFGDPRVMSSRTGKRYPTVEKMLEEEPRATEANEVIHFAIHSHTSAYGVPRWIGNLLSVLGSRNAEEVNFLYFENKSIPPLLITVSGGRMAADSVDKIRSFIENDVKGKRNFHKVMVIEAETTGAAAAMGLENAGRCRIEVKPLTETHNKDGLFQEYDERNMDKVGMSFRLPRLIRGDIRDFNRASAQASLEFAESQVFGPERQETDFVINRHILPALRIRYWTMVSNGPRITDPNDMADVLAKLTTCGILVPADGRELAASKVFYAPLKHIKGDWVDQPIPLTAAGFNIDTVDDDKIPAPGGDVSSSPPAAAAVQAAKRKARSLLRLRDALSEAEAEEELEALKKAKAEQKPKRVATDDDAEVIKLSPQQMRKQFSIEPR